MLPPHELKNKAFSKSMRGYNPIEVDEYIEFLISKYTEIYRENDELERKLKAAMTRLDELKNDEDSIKSTLIDAKRAAAKIKEGAEDRAEAIVRSAKSSCNTILRDFNEKIAYGRDVLAELQRDAFALKQELFERYSEHIRFIEKLTADFDEASLPEPTALRREAVNAIKDSIASNYPADSITESADDADPADIPAQVTFTAPDAPAPMSPAAEMGLSETAPIPFPDDDGPIPPPPTDPIKTDIADALADASTESETLAVNREPLVPVQAKRGLKDSVMELNREYNSGTDEIINTPDSDVSDEMSYLDFVKSVTGNPTAGDARKDAALDLLFDDGKNKSKKK